MLDVSSLFAGLLTAIQNLFSNGILGWLSELLGGLFPQA
jgi:hypothetical protein